MTLGRALFDTGDMAAARAELRVGPEGRARQHPGRPAARGVPGGGGDLEGALERYRATLALSPGDKQITARVADLEGKLQASARPAAAADRLAPPSRSPIKLAEVDEPMELEISREPTAPAAATAATPIPVTAAPAEFELETAYEAPGTQWGSTAPPETPIGERTVADEAAPVPIGARTLADEAPPPASSPVVVAPSPSLRRSPFPRSSRPPRMDRSCRARRRSRPRPTAVETPFVEPVVPPEPAAPEPAALEPAAPEPAPAAPMAAPAPVRSRPRSRSSNSPTLAELYFNQGFTEKAIEVYRQLLERDPGNERARARVAELEALAAPPRDGKEAAPRRSPPAPASSDDDEGARGAPPGARAHHRAAGGAARRAQEGVTRGRLRARR